MAKDHNDAQIAAGAERRRVVLRLRADGWTFPQIGRDLGISRSRAAQLHARAIELDCPDPLDVASTTPGTAIEHLPINKRAITALRNAGYEMLVEVMPLADDVVRALLRLPNLDRASLEELRSIADAIERRNI